MTSLPPAGDAGPPELNPYSPPETELSGPEGLDIGGDLAEAEAIRRAHLGHEASIKSVGSLHLLGAFFGVMVVISTVFVLLGGGPANQPENAISVGLVCAIYVVITALNLALGIGLHRLQTWARWTDVAFVSISTLLLLLGMAAMVIGLVMGAGPSGIVLAGLAFYAVFGLINGYILYLLIAPKAAMVFSPEYRTIIDRTPHIRYQTSLAVKVLLVLIVGLIVVGVVGGLVMGRR